MPHKCFRCGKIYKDGDKSLLSGCGCGSNRFYYIAEGRVITNKEHIKEEFSRIEGIETIKILTPGSYEINLNALFRVKKLIIILQEDGSYVMRFPSPKL